MSNLEEAEGRMSTTEQRLLSLEADGASGGNSAAVEQALRVYQQQVLAKLKAIRSQIMDEGGDVGTIKKERDEAVAQNALLRKEIDKQNYRIQHLIKALNKAEERCARGPHN
jgi:chromosome segregation ATPase